MGEIIYGIRTGFLLACLTLRTYPDSIRCLYIIFLSKLCSVYSGGCGDIGKYVQIFKSDKNHVSL